MVTRIAAARTVRDSGASSVLWKAFDVLGCFGPDSRSLSMSEIARRARLPKSTVHRVLSMLLDVGAVARCGDRYQLGVRMFVMGSCGVEAGLREVALPHLERLSRRTAQNVHLAVLRGADVVYVEKLRCVTAVPCPTVAGGSLPAHCTAIGKAMLAYSPLPTGGEVLERLTTRSVGSPAALAAELESVRAAGVAFDREESVVGLGCIAVPVLVGDRPIAGVSVAFPAEAGRGEPVIPLLRETVATICRDLVSAGSGSILDLLFPPERMRLLSRRSGTAVAAAE